MMNEDGIINHTITNHHGTTEQTATKQDHRESIQLSAVAAETTYLGVEGYSS
jgi:hypothetical protein